MDAVRARKNVQFYQVKYGANLGCTHSSSMENSRAKRASASPDCSAESSTQSNGAWDGAWTMLRPAQGGMPTSSNFAGRLKRENEQQAKSNVYAPFAAPRELPRSARAVRFSADSLTKHNEHSPDAASAIPRLDLANERAARKSFPAPGLLPAQAMEESNSRMEPQQRGNSVPSQGPTSSQAKSYAAAPLNGSTVPAKFSPRREITGSSRPFASLS